MTPWETSLTGGELGGMELLMFLLKNKFKLLLSLILVEFWDGRKNLVEAHQWPVSTSLPFQTAPTMTSLLLDYNLQPHNGLQCWSQVSSSCFCSVPSSRFYHTEQNAAFTHNTARP